MTRRRNVKHLLRPHIDTWNVTYTLPAVATATPLDPSSPTKGSSIAVVDSRSSAGPGHAVVGEDHVTGRGNGDTRG